MSQSTPSEWDFFWYQLRVDALEHEWLIHHAKPKPTKPSDGK